MTYSQQLRNLLEEQWNELFILTMSCPYCDTINDLTISITKSSIRIDCKNPKCNKVFFYRRVNLGSRE